MSTHTPLVFLNNAIPVVIDPSTGDIIMTHAEFERMRKIANEKMTAVGAKAYREGLKDGAQGSCARVDGNL
ncbi:hypothetical protein [Arthrobacter sp. UYCo732]|uniref:hypothetical protein n=1 Tax=Arthrobacter sp. UYCo732 TaxID=3156336 RepID=UPI0033921B21